MRRLFLALLMVSAFSCASLCEGIAVREWTPFSGATLTVKGGILSVTSTSQMPLIMSRNDLFVNAVTHRMLAVRIRPSVSYTEGRVFFKRIGDKDFNYYNSCGFQSGISGRDSSCIIDLGRNPNWYGVITQLILCPGSSTGSFEVESVRFLEPNIWLSLSAAWQEFMQFESIKGFTVNTIKGKSVGGRPVNSYLYFISLMSMLVIFLRNIKQLKFDGISSFCDSFKGSFKEIMVVCLILFAVLEARQAIDYSRQFYLDYSTLAGKTIDEKRALTTYGGLYEYVSFVKEHLPENAEVTLPTQDNYVKYKGIYYLFPIKVVNENADYILIFGAPAKEVKGFRVLAKLSDDQAILVRKGIKL